MASRDEQPSAVERLFSQRKLTPVLAKGWGLGGSDDAVIFIARRPDGSLYWRGLFVPLGTLTQ